MSLFSRSAKYAIALGVVVLLAACQTNQSPPAPAPLMQPPVATHVFTLHDDSDGVVGRLQVTRAHEEDTLSDIARRFNIGYEEIVRANPTVDPWLPHEGMLVILPTQFVLPDAPHNGVVINLAALRLFYFPPRKKGEPQTVITHPIGIGQIGWSTPVGNTKIIRKRANPVWNPPASVRREHAEDGEILPAKIGPGPDNPLGKYAFTLDWPSYLIHGTNQPYGVGLRASHGCIRLYPEDIAQLFGMIPVGTKVTVVNQPQVYGYRGATLYMQSYPVLDDYAKKPAKGKAKGNAARAKSISSIALKMSGDKRVSIDQTLVAELTKNPNGIAIPISQAETTVEKVVAAAPRVENRVPDNATWDGVE
ncbi:MAG TPA: L,D-transpeptidase family protein [Spongiibacteraceae bacterium]|nr:L,D-transpeptidase family protein [Spongiibacteraceae bacterium]